MAEYNIIENSFLSEKYYRIKHKSGLHVYVFSKKMTSSYAIFATQYGSADNKFKIGENSEYTTVPDGIAHFLEHKLFDNQDGKDAMDLFAETGADSNAYTSNYMTGYLFSCTENFYESLEVLLDFVTHPYFTDKSVKKEQGIIGQEIKMYEDHPYFSLQQKTVESLYKYNKIRIDVAGTIDSISKITPEYLYSCYNTFYNLNNMALCICGDVDPEKVIKVCDKVLKNAPEIDLIRDSEDENEPKEVFRKRYSYSLQIAKPIFEIAVKDTDIPKNPEERLRKGFAVDILCEILFSESSVFYNYLYDNDLISKNISSGYERSKHAGYVCIMSESKDAERVYKYFDEYIEKIKKDGISKEDFELAKRSVFASFIKCFDSTEEIANRMIQYLFDDCDILSVPKEIESVTYEYVFEIFEKMFKEEYYTMSVVNPIGKE